MVRLSTIKGYEARLDRVEARRALDLLIDPTDCHEMRGLPSGQSRLACGNDLDAALLAAASLADQAGLYITVNPVRPDLGNRAATNRDVTSRKRLYIDVDPVRPKGTNATEAEHEAARVVAEAIAADLTSRGWPSPILVDSGSGWHLHYSVDLPNDRLSQQLIRAFLGALAARHDTAAVKVDPGVHNAARIARLPGTYNRKGEATPDRPQRPCRLVSVPMAIVPVQVEAIRDYAGPGREETTTNGHVPTGSVRDHVRRMTDDRSAYVQAALRDEIGKVATVPIDRNKQLYESALKMGGYVASGLIGEAEVRDALTRAGKAAGLGEDGDPKEIERAIGNGLEVGKATPKVVPESKPEKGSKSKTKAEAVELGPDGKRVYPFPLIVKGSDVTPKRVAWLWPDRVPIGFLTLFAGRTSVGKSFITLDFAARLTTGEELPYCGGLCADLCNVLIISEDSQEYLLAPRLIELGADMARIAFMTFEAMASFDLSDIQMLDDAYAEAGRPRLVVIDPPTNFLGAKDEHKNAEVRGVLMGVAIWAMRHDLAVVMITHCNKGIKKDMAALDRIIGSVAWASTSRIAHILSPDPDEPDRCLFIPLKNNLGEMAKGLAYRIRKTDALAVVDWLGPVDMSGDQALSGEKKKPRGVAAVEWLAERFRMRREWPSEELKRDAAEAGVSKNALWSPEVNALPIRKKKRYDAAGDPYYVWVAEEGWPPGVEIVESETEKERVRRWLVLFLNLGDASPDRVIRYAKESGLDEAVVRAEFAGSDLFEEIADPRGETVWHYRERW